MIEKMQGELVSDTKQLLRLNEKAFAHFEAFPQKQESADFYETIKPFADEVKQALEKWMPSVLKWLEIAKPSYIHPQQIDELVENFEILSVTCFQPDTKKKKLIERHKSIEYTLSQILHTLHS